MVRRWSSGWHQEWRQSKTDADVVHDRNGDFSQFGKIPQVLNALEQNARRKEVRIAADQRPAEGDLFVGWGE